MKVDNLYRHADGGFYCLLIEDAPGKSPSTGPTDWEDGVIYVGPDGRSRWTNRDRWDYRFKPWPDYLEDDEDVLAMIRRCNPVEIDPPSVWAAWHDSETAINSEVLELAIAAAISAGNWADPALPIRHTGALAEEQFGVSIDIGPRHLQHILQNYTVEREPVEGGYRITVRK